MFFLVASSLFSSVIAARPRHHRESFGSGHCHWFNKDVDKMYLASEPIKKIAQKWRGVPDDKIVMSGLPIRRDFALHSKSLSGDRTTDVGRAHVARTKGILGLDPSRRMVLVMGASDPSPTSSTSCTRSSAPRASTPRYASSAAATRGSGSTSRREAGTTSFR